MKRKLMAAGVLALCALLSFGCGGGKAEEAKPADTKTAAQVDQVLSVGAKRERAVEKKEEPAPAKAKPVAGKLPPSQRAAAPKASAVPSKDFSQDAAKFVAHKEKWEPAMIMEAKYLYISMADIDRDGKPELMVATESPFDMRHGMLLYHLNGNGEPEEMASPDGTGYFPGIFTHGPFNAYADDQNHTYYYVGNDMEEGTTRLTLLTVSREAYQVTVLGTHTVDLSRGNGDPNAPQTFTDWKGNPITYQEYQSLESHAAFAQYPKRTLHFENHIYNRPTYGEWQNMPDEEKVKILAGSALRFEKQWNVSAS